MGKSARNISLAVVSAVLFHVLLLTQKLVFREHAYQEEKPITVTISEQELSPPPEPVIEILPILEPQQVDVEPEPEVDEPEPNLLNADELIVATKVEKMPQPRAVIQTSEQSGSFRRWLNSETASFARQNPGSIGSFDQTFVAPAPNEESNEFTVYNRENIPTRDSRGTGEFIIEKNGKRTCGLKVDSLLSSDSQGANGSAYFYRDCTPKKKFDLKLGQPNNGWTQR